MVLQGVLSRATFRRSPVSGQKCFTVLSLFISATFTPKRHIAKQLIITLRAIKLTWLQVFSWSCVAMLQQRQPQSVLLTKHLWAVSCLRHRALPPVWGTWVHSRWADVCGFLKPPGSEVCGKCISMVYFPLHGNPLVYVPPIKAAITKPGFIWTLLIGATCCLSKVRMNHAFPERMLIRESQKTYYIFRETFLQIQQRLLQHFIRKS